MTAPGTLLCPGQEQVEIANVRPRRTGHEIVVQALEKPMGVRAGESALDVEMCRGGAMKRRVIGVRTRRRGVTIHTVTAKREEGPGPGVPVRHPDGEV